MESSERGRRTGRHAQPRDGSFRRSLLAAFGRTALLVLVVVGVTVLAARFSGGGGDPVVRAPSERASGPAVAVPSPGLEDLPPDPGDALEALPSPTVEPPAPDPSEAGPVPLDPTEPPLTAGPEASPLPPVTVQVLYEGATEVAATDAQARLEELGYEVVAVNAVRRRIDVTTALAVEGHAEDARLLASREPRVAEVAPNDRYSATVDINLLVGRDWVVGEDG